MHGKINKMFGGVHINTTEDRSVLHAALRAPRNAVSRNALDLASAALTAARSGTCGCNPSGRLPWCCRRRGAWMTVHTRYAGRRQRLRSYNNRAHWRLARAAAAETAAMPLRAEVHGCRPSWRTARMWCRMCGTLWTRSRASARRWAATKGQPAHLLYVVHVNCPCCIPTAQ